MAKATIISVAPVQVDRWFPSVFPEFYVIPACKKDEFNYIHVNDAIRIVYLDDERGSISVPVNAEQLAKSVVGDFSRSFIEVDEVAHPGIFWVEGHLTRDEISKKCAGQIQAQRDFQTSWFRRLVKMADDDWARWHQHGMISDLHRFAATFLGFDREWIKVDNEAPKRQCPACFTYVDSRAIVCSNCRCILNPTTYATMKFAEK